MIGPLGWGSK